MATRRNIMLGTAGHVDHGKTSLAKVLTGCDLDTLPAEKERGLTIEIGFAPCRMHDQRIVGIVDVPGHAGFIRNMVAGAHGIDIVILVVAADDGVMPQTREHLDILALMGVRQGLVALTKIDLVDPTMRELAAEDVRSAVAGTFLQDAPICPLSNVTGEGYSDFLDTLNRLVDACPDRPVGGLFRLWIERSFAIKGFGTVVSGVPSSGALEVGKRYEIVPGGRLARVRHLEVYGEDSPAGRVGECVAVNLADVEHEGLERGRLLCEPGTFDPVTLCEAQLWVLPSIPAPLKDNAQVHLHVGTAEVMADIAILDARTIGPGERRMVQLRLSEPLGVAAGDRFVVRAAVAGHVGGHLTTLGGGRIVSTSNLRLRRNRPWTIAALNARWQALDDPAAWCDVVLRESGEALGAEALARRASLPAPQVAQVLPGLLQTGAVLEAGGGAFVHRDAVADLAHRMTQHIEAFHTANPLRLGIAAADLQALVQAPKAVFDVALRRLIDEKAVLVQGNALARAGRKAVISEKDRQLAEHISQVFRTGALAAPSPAEVQTSLGLNQKHFDTLLRLLCDQGDLVRLSDQLVLHREAVDGAKAVARRLLADKGSFLTMEFRDALGASRKYAVPLLDYFDSIRLTVRNGNKRTPGAMAVVATSAGADAPAPGLGSGPVPAPQTRSADRADT